MTAPPNAAQVSGARRPRRQRLGRAAASLAIAASLALQGLATTRLLCPPRALAALAPLRVACTPALWPFIDYPMYSRPHRPGDALAWIEVASVGTDGARVEHGAFRVLRDAADEPWADAFARAEADARRALAQAGLATAGELVVVRHRRVLTRAGLVDPDRPGAPGAVPR